MGEINLLVQTHMFLIVFQSTSEKEKGVITANHSSNSAINHADPLGKGSRQREIKNIWDSSEVSRLLSAER